MLDNTSTQPSKFRTQNWVQINDELRVKYKVNNEIRFKTTMLRSSLYDYSNAYIFVKGTKTTAGPRDNDEVRKADK